MDFAQVIGTKESKRSCRYILLLMRFVLKALLTTVPLYVLAGILVTSMRAGTRQDCGKAEKQVIQGTEPKSWGSLYRLFKQFGDCDDGAIGEGFSEDVAQLFSKQWAHLDALSRLTASDKPFERFVLRHIDATLTDDELKAIANNSKSRCPTGEKRFCQLLQARVQSSLNEQRDYSK
jgi:hypothetical protein